MSILDDAFFCFYYGHVTVLFLLMPRPFLFTGLVMDVHSLRFLNIYCQYFTFYTMFHGSDSAWGVGPAMLQYKLSLLIECTLLITIRFERKRKEVNTSLNVGIVQITVTKRKVKYPLSKVCIRHLNKEYVENCGRTLHTTVLSQEDHG